MMSEEQQIMQFMERANPQPQRAQRNTEALIKAALLFDDEQPPEAVLLGRSYEPYPAWEVLRREVRGVRGKSAYGIRRFDGMWHPQTYATEGRASQVRDGLALAWMDGVETTTVTEFNLARGENETLEEWRQRQGIDRFGARLGSDAARVGACLTAEPKSAWQVLLEAGYPPSERCDYLDSLVERGLLVKDGDNMYSVKE